MSSYDDWNKLEEEEEDELQDNPYETKRDVILFCIDCSESMLEPYEDPQYEDQQTCHLLTALEAAVEIQKKKVIVGPSDSVGIMFYNTTRRNDTGQSTDIKKGTFVYQPIESIGAERVLKLTRLIADAREDPGLLRKEYPPMTSDHVAIGDVFTSCNWVLRDGAPKTASKRIFVITDNDDPHPGTGAEKLVVSARTTLIDLVQAGIMVEPFFISDEDTPFNPTKFWANVLLSDLDSPSSSSSNPSILPESISITRIDDLLEQMRFHEVPKRALFSIPFQLADGFTIGIKGYGLVTEQRKGAYRYFADLGDRMEVVEPKTLYVDNESQHPTDKKEQLYGMTLGVSADDDGTHPGTRVVPPNTRVFYTAEEVKKFRSLGLEPSIKLLGFKDRDQLLFEDNIKHSYFIYPDEMAYTGSKRTASALIKSMAKKRKIGLVLALFRRGSSPIFCAMLAQEEKIETGGWREPGGFHLIPLPFADDIRAAPIEEGFIAPKELARLAETFVLKCSLKDKKGYSPDTYPNPALQFHHEQLQATAFREEYDPETFVDLTLPKYEMFRKRAAQPIREWKEALEQDESANATIITTGSKRKAAAVVGPVDENEIRKEWEAGRLEKLKVDQMKEFLRAKGLPVSGKKVDLMSRISEWLDSH